MIPFTTRISLATILLSRSVNGFLFLHQSRYRTHSMSPDAPSPSFSRLLQAEQSDDDTFDPLMSPHSYPNGIDAGAEPTRRKTYISTGRRADEPADTNHKTSVQPTNPVEDPLLFDPLLSPHAYPKGTDSGPVGSSESQSSTTTNNNTRKPFGIALPGEDTTQNRKPIDPDTFDPTISPHAYSSGSQQSPTKDEERRRGVGILLIDHGSKSAAANDRLEEVADRYRTLYGGLVRVAHMEIAEPSIRDGIQAFLEDDGVDEILCHPYFLSPGRHVREDIPRLVEEAINELNVQIPCHVSKHVGSETDAMVDAIHSLVSQSSKRLS